MAHRFWQMDQVEKLGDAGIARLAPHAMVEGERASQDVFHGLRWIERCVGVLEHDLYLAEFVEAAAGVSQFAIIEDNMPCVGRQDARNRPCKSGLPAAGFADDAELLPPLPLEADGPD